MTEETQIAEQETTSPKTTEQLNDEQNLDVKELEKLDKEVDVLTDDEIEIQKLQEQLQQKQEEQQQSLPTEQQQTADSFQAEAEQTTKEPAPEETASEQMDEEMLGDMSQMQNVQPVPLETIQSGLNSLLGNDLKELDKILDSGEGSLSETVAGILAKYTQAIGYEIANSLQPVLAPLVQQVQQQQMQMQQQQAQQLWQQFSAQHPEILQDKQLFDTMKKTLETGEATTYQAAYDIARARLGKINSTSSQIQAPTVDKAKIAAANLISATANRNAAPAPTKADTVEEAAKQALLQLGLT